MTEVTIKNFQSIKKVSFKIEGLTVIVGKNNIGKSAVIRAVEAALTNQTGSAFIRKGENSTEVTIKRNDLEIEWNKDITTASYKIKIPGEKPKTFSKLKGAIPKPIVDAGIDKMEIGDQKVFPLVASQFDPLFLINKPGPVVTDVLASLYNINTLGVADDLCWKAMRSEKSLLKTREKDLEYLQGKLAKYMDFETIKKSVSDLVAKEKTIETLKSQVTEIAEFEQKLQALTKSLGVLKGIKKVQVPNTADMEELLSVLCMLKEMENSYQYLSTSLKKLKGITGIAVPAVGPLETILKDTSQIIEWESNLNTIKSNLSKEDLLNSIEINKTHSIEQIGALLEDFKNITGIENQFMEFIKTAKDIREQLRAAIQEYDLKSKELEQNVCPTCGRPYERN